MKQLCVFCGSNPGSSPFYIEEAKRLGTQLANEGITLVYGGSKLGIMGAIATATLEAGGKVIGVMPNTLMNRELAHTELTELIVVETMHERKAKMSELSDGFIALPGGLGTMEEFFEIFTWAQIGEHQKPIGLLNTNHFYDKLLDFLNHMIQEQFLMDEQYSMIIVEQNPIKLLQRCKKFIPVHQPKWMNPQA